MCRLIIVIALVMSLVACAGGRASQGTPVGTSDLEVLPPPPRQPTPEGYTPKLRPPETAPEVQERNLPLYPEAALDDQIACVVRLLYHIQPDGSVNLVRLEWDDHPPPDHEAAFEASIRDAISHWRYTPGKKWVPTKMEDGSTTTVPQAIPKSERAIVRFRVKNGQGIVE